MKPMQGSPSTEPRMSRIKTRGGSYVSGSTAADTLSNLAINQPNAPKLSQPKLGKTRSLSPRRLIPPRYWYYSLGSLWSLTTAANSESKDPKPPVYMYNPENERGILDISENIILFYMQLVLLISRF